MPDSVSARLTVSAAMSGGVNWYEKLLDWGWATLVAVAAAALYAYRKITSHEDRLQSLEAAQQKLSEKIDAHQDQRTRQLEALNTKLDTQTSALIERIDDQAKETRSDIRMITSKLLDKVPGS
jgi:vacuolar-type H+-ATPase subunit I/STV1